MINPTISTTTEGHVSFVVIRLPSRETVVGVELVSEADAALSQWNPALAQIKALDAERKGQVKIILMAFSDGAEPPKEIREGAKPVLMNWKVVIISKPDTLKRKLMRRGMELLITLAGLTEKFLCINPNQTVAAFDHMRLTASEQQELRRQLRELAVKKPNQALKEFVNNLPA